MNNLKVGEYVRTKKGKIFKYGKGRTYLGKDNEILNHSFNIKELIEEGDIVEYQVNSLSKLKVGRVNSYRDTRSNKECLCVEGFDITKIAKIRTILTHEQYERNCYRLEND